MLPHPAAAINGLLTVAVVAQERQGTEGSDFLGRKVRVTPSYKQAMLPKSWQSKEKLGPDMVAHSVISANREEEIRRIWVQGHARKKLKRPHLTQ
jgi:hypothetical protein